MAKFKVGDRVRVIDMPSFITMPQRMGAIGREATIVSIPSDYPRADCDIEVDNFPARELGYADLPWAVQFWQIAPLTPPAADAWATEQVKKWTKPEPSVPVKKLDHA